MSAAMSKTEEQVLVVKREFFDGLGSFQGLCRRVDDYLPAFMKKENNFFVPRGEAEEDPSLKQRMDEARKAMDEARKAMNEAMVKADPTVESILAKIKPPAMGGKWDGKKGGRSEPGERREGGPGKHPGMASLSESEREQLKGLRERVKGDPAVIAARDAKKNASTPEARRSADEALHKAMHDAMIKADSTIGPILEKLRPAPAQQPQQR
jgi:hypothetical protein